MAVGCVYVYQTGNPKEAMAAPVNDGKLVGCTFFHALSDAIDPPHREIQRVWVGKVNGRVRYLVGTGSLM